MDVRIRPFRVEDYEALERLFNAAYSDAEGQPVQPEWPAELRQNDAERPDFINFLRLVAERDGELVGVCEYDQTPHRYHPHKYWFDLYVDPEQQRCGIGTMLYNRVIGELLALDPLSVRAQLREDMTSGLAFLERHGWREQQRIWESYLDAASANLAPFAGAVDRVAAEGIAIKTYDELAADSQRDQKLYDLAWKIRLDLPDLDEPTQESFERWSERRMHTPEQMYDAFFMALDGDRYVGFLYHSRYADDPTMMKVTQLGVDREYRGRGIATALKVLEIEYARANGIATIRTSNESNNRAILSINERMGFARRPAWIDMVKMGAER